MQRPPPLGPIEQATAVPYRLQDGRVQFCLVTNSQGKRWGFPKGVIEPGQTPIDTALAEAEEEAGIHGLIDTEPLGDYEYCKWNRTLHVVGFLMRVTLAHDNWLEAKQRARRWCSAEQARKKIDRPALLELLGAALERLSADPARSENSRP